ncbi:MAG: hypothetical protein JF616_12485 [Fibrobacteres bacterium]|jgi:hypothetical protein|nr:hypothetical protein [Fibrobacterota bacterium]
MNTSDKNSARKRPARISNAARLRIFIGAGLFLSAAILVTSCREDTKKHSFTEVKGFNTPVQSQDISLPATPSEAPPDIPAHAGLAGKMGDGAAIPDIPAHAGLASKAAAGAAAPAAASAEASAHLAWQLPKGWTAQPGSGMYYAIIKTSSDASASEIGVLSLPGEAGGLQANAERWMGQLGLKNSADEVSSLLSNSRRFKSTGNLDVTLLDFASAVKGDDASSMMVAIAKPAGDSYFIKMVGKKSVLAKHRQEFASLCNTLVYE